MGYICPMFVCKQVAVSVPEKSADFYAEILSLSQRFLTCFNSRRTKEGTKIVKANHQFSRRDCVNKKRVLRLCLKA
jgi:hypothetical protein